MGDEDETPTDKPPMPAIPAPTEAPTISIEADDAGELHEAPTVPGDAGAIAALAADIAADVGAAPAAAPDGLKDPPAPDGATPPDAPPTAPPASAEAVADKPLELCDAQCGTAVAVRCKIEKGHEDPDHPAHVKHSASGDPFHDSGHVRWAVDQEAAEVAAVARNRQLLADAQELDRLSKLGHE